MPGSTLSLPGALESEPVMPWAQVEIDPDEALFEDEEDWDDLDDLDEPDELEFGDDDWDDEDEFDGFVTPDEDSEEAVGW